MRPRESCHPGKKSPNAFTCQPASLAVLAAASANPGFDQLGHARPARPRSWSWAIVRASGPLCGEASVSGFRFGRSPRTKATRHVTTEVAPSHERRSVGVPAHLRDTARNIRPGPATAAESAIGGRIHRLGCIPAQSIKTHTDGFDWEATAGGPLGNGVGFTVYGQKAGRMGHDEYSGYSGDCQPGIEVKPASESQTCVITQLGVFAGQPAETQKTRVTPGLLCRAGGI